jgi:hypothetical protein
MFNLGDGFKPNLFNINMFNHAKTRLVYVLAMFSQNNYVYLIYVC